MGKRWTDVNGADVQPAESAACHFPFAQVAIDDLGHNAAPHRRTAAT
jgi:hypothetical protein